MRAGRAIAALALGGVLAAAALTTATDNTTAPAMPAWTAAGPGHAWSFPRDHHAHPGHKTEWWYLTGQLAAPGEPEPRFGFQFTVFRIGLTPVRPDLDSDWAARDLIMGHVAVTDRDGRHVFSEVLTRAAAGLGGVGAVDDSLIAWCRAPAGTDGTWSLRRREGGFRIEAADRRQGVALALDLTPERPPVLQGPGGFSVKDAAAGAGSLYYSLTRLATAGRLVAGDDTLRVAGRSWLDHEIFSSQLGPDQVGWDWFGLQLDDGRDLMAYRLRRADGSVATAHATLVEADGTVRHLPAAEVELVPGRRWRSPETGAEYPVAWRLRLPADGLDLAIEPWHDGQENVSRRTAGLRYWEGAVTVRPGGGSGPAGRGYVEMTGYGPHARLPL